MKRLWLIPVMTMALLVPGCGSGSSGPPVCTNPTPADTVKLVDFAFDPTCVAARPGSTLTLTNTGTVPHTFTVEGTDVNVTVDAGTTRTADLSGVTAGTYTVVCTIHPQMVGALKVG